jgi:hypothetical protein
MELRIALRRRKPVLCKNGRIVQINRIVIGLARRIDVDNVEIFAARTWVEFIFPFYFISDDADERRFELRDETWIEGVSP